MSRKPETRLQERIREALERAFPGSYWRKIHGNEFQHSGIADLLGCVVSLFFAFEVKMPGKEDTESELQRDERELVCSAGGGAVVITSSAQAIAFVKRHLRKHGVRT